MRLPHFPLVQWRVNNKKNLSNMYALLNGLGNPHKRLPPVVHIAGTNGKGSSLAYLQSIFSNAGFKVHAYSSPHLVEYNERIVVKGEMISDEYLFELCERTRIITEELKLDPGFFEATTAIAFLAFSEIEADILILETGIGGLLDSTNVIESPIATLITPISFDHMDYLGYDLVSIASQKAGIIKANSPCVISSQVDIIYEYLLNKCYELNVPAFCYDYDFTVQKTDNGFLYLSQNISHEFPFPSLPGDHQLINAGSVIALISLINNHFNINVNSMKEGLLKTIWPARIQKIDKSKYRHIICSENLNIWVDGAHNSAGAQVLASWIKDNFNEPVYLILGMTKNRNIEDFCSYFKNLVNKIFTVKVMSEASSYSAEILEQRISNIGIFAKKSDSIEDAIKEINLLDGSKNIIITGSLFLSSDFLSLLRNQNS